MERREKSDERRGEMEEGSEKKEKNNSQGVGTGLSCQE